MAKSKARSIFLEPMSMSEWDQLSKPITSVSIDANDDRMANIGLNLNCSPHEYGYNYPE